MGLKVSIDRIASDGDSNEMARLFSNLPVQYDKGLLTKPNLRPSAYAVEAYTNKAVVLTIRQRVQLIGILHFCAQKERVGGDLPRYPWLWALPMLKV